MPAQDPNRTWVGVTDGDWFRFLRALPPDYRIHVSGRLRRDFGNGEIYYPLENQEIRLPKGVELRPNRGFLEWHSETVFRP